MKNQTFHCLLILIGLSLFSTGLFAQNTSRITVIRGGNSLFFASMDSLISQTQNGDSVIFPGGVFIIPAGGVWLVDKQLHIMGGGYRPDSSFATSRTSLVGSIQIRNGADYGSLQGVHITGNLRMHAYNIPNSEVSNFTVSRCYIGEVLYFQGGGPGNNLFAECIFVRESTTNTNFTVVEGSYTQNTTFRNCIFKLRITEFSNCHFTNCLFLSSGSSLSYIYNCIFSGNIFVSNSYLIANTNYATGCLFQNNTFVEASPGFGVNSATSNLFNQPQNSLFINQTGHLFNFGHDYHLQPSSPANTAGVGGTQTGIYGGNYPFKDGAHPQHPQIKFAKVAPNTDSNGNLQIEFKVKAQP